MARVVYYVKDNSSMAEVKDDSVTLIVTSPPEFKFSDSSIPLPGLKQVLGECERVLSPGGFLLWNVGAPSLDLSGDDLRKAMEWKVYYHLYHAQTIIQVTGLCPLADFVAVYRLTDAPPGATPYVGKAETDHAAAEGQVLRGHEHWLAFTKGRCTHPLPTIDNFFVPPSSREFDEATLTTLIGLFTDKGDLVLDPYAGTGMVGRVALKMGRDSAMYEIDPSFVPVVKRRVPSVEVVRA